MFSARLNARIASLRSKVCLGIDPRPEAHPYTSPARHGHDHEAVADAVVDYFGAILEATHDLIACCKPQSAFFEALGLPGLRALQELMAKARELGVPVILDAKRSDIGSTAEAYASAYLQDGPFGADALTVNPFLGLDTLEPFIERALDNGRGLFVLVRTSNPGSADLQGLALAEVDSAPGPAAGSGRRPEGEPGQVLLYRHLAARLAERAADLPRDDRGYGPLGAVVGASHGEEARSMRELMPSAIFLVPGYGAQGGTAASVRSAFDEHGLGAVVSASRSLTYAEGTSAVDDLAELAAAVRGRVEAMRAELQLAASPSAAG